MAFDARLRLGLERNLAPEQTVAFDGAAILDGAVPVSFGGSTVLPTDGPEPERPRHRRLVAGLYATADDAGAGGRPATDADARLLARMAVAIAMYETAFRQHDYDQRLDTLTSDATVDDVLGLVDDAFVDDVVNLTAWARSGFGPLFPAGHVECNPVVGRDGVPADGDMIIDGTLVDIKTVNRAEVKPEWLWQLVGYVLLGTGLHITDLALYFARHAHLRAWSLDEVMSTLAGEPVTVTALREEFDTVIRSG